MWAPVVVQLDNMTPIASTCESCGIHGIPGTASPFGFGGTRSEEVAVFHCTLDPDCSQRLLEIPQWMFDARVVCLIRVTSSPLASDEALRELKALINSQRAVGHGEVIQAQHQSLSHQEGSDAKPSQVSPSQPTATVSSTAFNPSLAKPATRGSSSDRKPSRTMVSRTSARRHRSGKPGGAR
jgi:hypothetical protein